MEIIKVGKNKAGEIRLDREEGKTILAVAKIGIFEYDEIQDFIQTFSRPDEAKDTVKAALEVIKMLFPWAKKEDFRGVDITELLQKGLKIAVGGSKPAEQKKTRGKRKKESPT